MFVLKDVPIQVVARSAYGRTDRRRKSVATFRLRVVVHRCARCNEECFISAVEGGRVIVMR